MREKREVSRLMSFSVAASSVTSPRTTPSSVFFNSSVFIYISIYQSNRIHRRCSGYLCSGRARNRHTSDIIRALSLARISMLFLNRFVTSSYWQSIGLLVARLIVAGVFGIALAFKIMNISGTATEIAGVGLPFALPLAWAAAIFELLVVLAFLSGAYFRQFTFLTMLYVLFLGFMFHGPSHWTVSMDEFGFFIDHFTFAAGLIAMIASGPGRVRLAWGN
ncbi:MAG: DoxX family protein [Candidatus Paceibacteria bacterium]